MVTIQETELNVKGLEALKRAKQDGRPILISEVHKMDGINPLHFFTLGNESFRGERFFWKDPADELVLVGLGIAKQIQTDQPTDRFFLVEKEWKHILTHSYIINPYLENGLGPVLFGGFSFDPLKEKTELWGKFDEALFHLPKYMLTVVDSQTYLTTNIVLMPEDETSLLTKVMAERSTLLNSLTQKISSTIPQLLEKQEIAPDHWIDSVAKLVKGLKNGPLKKVVLARELRLTFEDSVPVEPVLSELYKMQHDSYLFAFESNGDCFIGASPERLVKKEANNVFSTCLAGSISRGETEEEDQLLGNELLHDQKNLIEHGYVVEMIKEALEESCNEVILPDRPQLMKKRDIQHLYTPVIGKCHPDTSLLLLTERLHPTPALGGLPKQAAVEKIRELEALDRGFYGAPLGWLDYRSNGEFAVAIRSGLLQGSEASLFAGCGVVADSDPESEYLETGLKFRPMLRALGGK